MIETDLSDYIMAVDPIYAYYSAPRSASGGGKPPPIPVYEGSGVVSSIARNVALPVLKNTARDFFRRGLAELQDGSGVISKKVRRRRRKRKTVAKPVVKRNRRRRRRQTRVRRRKSASLFSL